MATYPLVEKNVNTNFQRRSMSVASPLRKRAGRTERTVLLENVNDEAERSSRRSLVDIQRRLSNIPQASPQNDSQKFLGEQDVKEHFQICSKLFTENKITSKNAWKLHIIDVLKHMVNKAGPNTLQVAGTSLDISAKVYSIRVDDLHADGLKLANNVSRISGKEVQDLDENNIDGDNEDVNAAPKAKKHKKRLLADKKNTISKDPKMLIAPLPKLNSVSFSTRTDNESSAIDNLFTNRLKMDCSGYKFMILSIEKAWTEESDPVVQNKKTCPLDIKAVNSLKVCIPFRDFQLDDWDPDKEDQQLDYQKSFIDNHEVVYDEDGFPIHELDGSVHDAFDVPQDPCDAEDDIESIHEEIVALQLRGTVAQIVEFRPDMTNGTLRSEYSYNPIITTHSGKLIDQIWAGPSHWKLKFIKRSSVRMTGPLTNQAKQYKAGRKKAPPAPLNYDEDYEELDMTKVLKVKKRHLADVNKVTLPIADISCKKMMECINELMTKPGVCTVKKANKPENQVDYEVNTYKYENPNDSQYCSQHLSDEPDQDNFNDDYGDGDHIEEEHVLLQQEFLGENLVDAPELVPKSYLPYALQAKKMDMKKLKAAVWQELTNTSLNKDTEDRQGSTVIPTTFSKMFKDLPKLLPEKMQKELSCPLAVVALLHLCNEQNLQLMSHNDNKDFDIRGPKSRS